MASSALCCPVRQVLVHLYPGRSKAWSEPCSKRTRLWSRDIGGGGL